MHKRGSIYNRDRAKQLRDYTGLRFGNITPTDIDGIIEYQNKAYIIYEVKLEGADFPFGQRLALERLTDDLERSGKPALLIISSHNIQNSIEDIDVANTFVIKYRLKGEWFPINSKLELTTRKITELFLDNLRTNTEKFHRLCIQNSKQLIMNGWCK